MICATASAITPAALAQEAIKEPNWPAIRKADLAAIDRTTVQRWLDAQIQNLISNEDIPATRDAASKFHKKLMEQLTASDAAAPFKERVSDMVAGSFSKAYQVNENSAKSPHPLGASAVLMVLRDAPRPTALPCFKSALSDPTPGPRFVAAEGLLALQKSFTQQDWTGLIPDLQKAAIAETNNPALSRIFRLLFAAPGDTAASTILAILESRSASFEKDGRMPLRADGEAMAWLANRAEPGTDATLRVSVTRCAAHLLANAVHSYVNEKPGREHMEQLELVILLVEPRLVSLAKAIDRNFKVPEPTVQTALQSGGSERHQKMTSAMTAWIGAGETQGVLNKPPFSFPVELGIKRPSPASVPASEPVNP